MNFWNVLKEKLPFIILQALLIAFTGGLLNFYKVDLGVIIVVCISMFAVSFVSFLFDYQKKNKYYNEIQNNLSSLDKKHYISTMLEIPDFEEGKILCEILEETSKSMNDEISIFRRQMEEYRDYIETWVHEIKLPIACIDLMCENNKNEFTVSVANELNRIDSFVEQALYYARCFSVEKDYFVKKTSLLELVRDSIKKHSQQLIQAKSNIQINLPDSFVYCDPKWLDFILGQIISNSIKYKREQLVLTFEKEESKENITLKISDNGIGIPKNDLKRVFERGFTGLNGRQTQKSTGMGLYLCKTLCDKMYLGFEIESTVNSYTCVKIIFPKDSRTLLI